jgi:hypothetical protein
MPKTEVQLTELGKTSGLAIELLDQFLYAFDPSVPDYRAWSESGSPCSEGNADDCVRHGIRHGYGEAQRLVYNLLVGMGMAVDVEVPPATSEDE